MAWFKVDDGLHASHKVLSIPRSMRLSSIGLWTLAGAWSADQELDGYIPDFMVTELGGTPRIVGALVKSGLWSEARPDGYQFQKWAEYQPTRADLDAQRAKDAERKRRYREQHAADGSQTPSRDQGVTEPRPSLDQSSVTPWSPSDSQSPPDDDRHEGTAETSGKTGHVPTGRQQDSAWDTTGSPNTPSRPVPTRPQDSDNTGSVSPVDDRARDLGLTDRGVSSIINAVSLHCDIEATDAEAVELAAHICGKAKTAPRSPAAYVRNAIESGPSEIDAWFRAHRRHLKAAS